MGAKGMWTEFKAFAFKGNLVDLAVAVIIGGAFGLVIKSLVDDIIMPTVSYAVTAAHEAGEVAKKAADKVSVSTGVKPTTAATTQSAEDKAKDEDAKAKEAIAKVAADAETEKVKPFITAAKALLKAETDAKAEEEKAKAASAPPPTEAVKIEWKLGRLNMGNFLGAIINFLIVAFAVFVVVVKGIGGAMARMNKVQPGEPTTKECPRCCSTIAIKASKCPNCTSDI